MQYLLTQFEDQVALLGDRNKLPRGDESLIWMLPAGQGLDSNHLARLTIDDRLKVSLQLVVVYCIW